MGIHPCSNRRPSQGQFVKGFHGLLNSMKAQVHLACISPKLLAQSDGDCILKVGSANFKDRMELLFLRLQCLVEIS